MVSDIYFEKFRLNLIRELKTIYQGCRLTYEKQTYLLKIELDIHTFNIDIRSVYVSNMSEVRKNTFSVASFVFKEVLEPVLTIESMLAGNSGPTKCLESIFPKIIKMTELESDSSVFVTELSEDFFANGARAIYKMAYVIRYRNVYVYLDKTLFDKFNALEDVELLALNNIKKLPYEIKDHSDKFYYIAEGDFLDSTKILYLNFEIIPSFKGFVIIAVPNEHILMSNSEDNFIVSVGLIKNQFGDVKNKFHFINLENLLCYHDGKIRLYDEYF